jgi:2-C-methyl-D-erythritol 2,4-cyclodiphosphate synthase
MRIGFGYDAHRLVEGRALILGGARIAYPRGLLGHSDGDVLIHSIGDAILGASGAGDIGRHFPDTDERYKGIDSLILLKKIMKITNAKVINIDSTIVCEKPRLSEYIPQMREKISGVVGIKKELVSIKATTEEGMGFTGEGEGISAYSVVLVE